MRIFVYNYLGSAAFSFLLPVPWIFPPPSLRNRHSAPAVPAQPVGVRTDVIVYLNSAIIPNIVKGGYITWAVGAALRGNEDINEFVFKSVNGLSEGNMTPAPRGKHRSDGEQGKKEVRSNPFLFRFGEFIAAD